ncbi:MAG: hypothetical protein K0S63_1392 [Gammaproteobacteria bacterium]|jgi:hypothetical protein|nr:hypothetical protein [Gammaproteobacteria bacterium]
MIIDTSAWKINDSKWVNKREEDWSIFERWLNKWYSAQEGRLLESSIKNAKNFYFNGVLDKDFEARGSIQGVSYEAAVILFPDITTESVREVINFYFVQGKREDLKGYFRHYFLERSRYLDLINAKVLSEDFILVLLQAVYGASLEETAGFLEFDLKSQYFEVVYSLGPLLYAYYFKDDQDNLTCKTANFLLPLYLQALININDEEAERCDYIFEQHVKRKKKYYNAGLIADPDRLQFMEKLLAGVKSHWADLAPVARKKLSGLFE